MRQVLTVLGPDGFVSVLAVSALALIVAAVGGHIPIHTDAVAPFVVLVALLGVTAAARAPLLLVDRRRFARELRLAARAFVPFVVAYVCYRAIAGATSGVTGAGVEDRLRALDEALVGVSPSFWMQRFVSPWLTELMAFGYALMFVLPLGVMLHLAAHNRWPELRTVTLSLVAAFYLGLVGYLLVPARSPRLCYDYAVPLRGVFGLYERSEWAWDTLQVVTYDAFPSLHTAVSTIAVVWAWRLAPRAWLAVYVPCALLLQVSTLYLRQHYLVDLMAGWALAALVVWLAPRLQLAWAKFA